MLRTNQNQYSKLQAGPPRQEEERHLLFITFLHGAILLMAIQSCTQCNFLERTTCFEFIFCRDIYLRGYRNFDIDNTFFHVITSASYTPLKLTAHTCQRQTHLNQPPVFQVLCFGEGTPKSHHHDSFTLHLACMYQVASSTSDLTCSEDGIGTRKKKKTFLEKVWDC